MNTQKLQSIAILLLAIGQILINIRMSSYVRDMNSLWESQAQVNQLFQEFCSDVLDFQSICLSFQDKVLDYAEIVECSHQN